MGKGGSAAPLEMAQPQTFLEGRSTGKWGLGWGGENQVGSAVTWQCFLMRRELMSSQTYVWTPGRIDLLTEQNWDSSWVYFILDSLEVCILY